MSNQQPTIQYLLYLADTALIHSHRLSEWCGHGPILEVDMALTNIALDHLGAARSLYAYAAQIEGNDKTEDYYPYQRTEREFYNLLIAERPNGDFADTIAKCFCIDAFLLLQYGALTQSSDAMLQGIALKSLKEVKYHFKFSSEWIVRLGDGTEESKQKIQNAINSIWMFTGEFFILSDYEKELITKSVAIDTEILKENWKEKVNTILKEAHLAIPLEGYMQRGGKNGLHAEYLGYILAEMQYLQRVYPNSEW